MIGCSLFNPGPKFLLPPRRSIPPSQNGPSAFGVSSGSGRLLPGRDVPARLRHGSGPVGGAALVPAQCRQAGCTGRPSSGLQNMGTSSWGCGAFGSFLILCWGLANIFWAWFECRGEFAAQVVNLFVRILVGGGYQVAMQFCTVADVMGLVGL